MGAVKHYMMELAEKLDKDFEELTEEDIQNDQERKKLNDACKKPSKKEREKYLQDNNLENWDKLINKK